MALWQDKLIAWADECEISPKYFPRDKKALENLKELDLSKCGYRFTSLPDELKNLQHLEKLILTDNRYFRGFPKVICELTNLKELDLNNSALDSLPDEFANLQELEKLNLFGAFMYGLPNSFNEFPKAICKLTKLKELYLGECDFTSLPNELSNLKSLERLHLNVSEFEEETDKFQDYFKVICKLKNLKELDLDEFNFTYLPDELANLQGLEILKLTINKFSNFPKVVCKLKSLKSLDLSACELTSLPDELENLQKLENLHLSNNVFKDFPKTLCKLKSLKELYLSNCGLSAVPDEIANLKQLESLGIGMNAIFINLDVFDELNRNKFRNKFTNFPKVLCELITLKELDLRYCNLSFLPDEIGKLKQLERLILRGNKITHLPKTFYKLAQLKELDCNQCSVKSLPDKFENLQELEILDLNGDFKAFPKAICKLKNLKILHLSDCGLTSLPDELANLQKLEKLSLYDNKFKEFPSVLRKLKLDFLGISDELKA